MSNDVNHSFVELKIGRNEVRLEGTEEFISQELSTILEKIDLVSQQQDNLEGSLESGQSTHSDEDIEVNSSDSDKEPSESEGVLKSVAKKLGVDIDIINDHFYIDNGDIHIANPLDIEPKYALIGYCIMKEYKDDEIYHDNLETKRKIIDSEKVNVERWGDLLSNLRRSGHIKDDPSYQGERNKPFKVTPKGQKELVEWINEDS